jgi:hypothetical protein
VRLVKDGPNLPVEVLQKLEDEELVFFCGSGVSGPLGLPGFGGLVDNVYKRLAEDKDEQEQEACDQFKYDIALGLLEDRIGTNQVRKALIAELYVDPESRRLNTHKSMLELAKFSDGAYRLVTTNFDRAFRIAGGDKLSVDSAPMLPIPRNHKWASVVHLHGLIDDKDQYGKNLVLSSADFGQAYLTERWASRFVAELFRRYSVVFVGYSIDDPVVRYMMDALAADRRQGDHQVHKAYILAPSDKRGMDKARRTWAAKHVEPILYNKHTEHVLLHRTLKAWANLHRDGITGKDKIVQQQGSILPVRPYDESIEQVLWALSEPTGHVAALFSRLDPLPPIEWLEVLEGEGHLATLVGASEDWVVPIVDPGYRTSCPAPLSPTARSLAGWLAKHLDKVELLQWVIARGTCLHPEMRQFIRGSLASISMSSALRKVWSSLSSETYSCDCENVDDYYQTLREISNGSWDASLKQRLLYYLTPYVRFGEPWRLWEEMPEDEEQEPSSVGRIVEILVKLRSGDHSHTIVDDLSRLENSDRVLADLLDGLTTHLVNVWDLLASLDKADTQNDLSYVHQPSIEPHEQNQGFEDWTKLIGLIAAGWAPALAQTPDEARACLYRWLAKPYPIFRRLAMFALANSDFYSPSDVVRYLQSNNSWWLWSVETQRELFRLLDSVAARLSADDARVLHGLIENGPPREMFKTDLDAEGFRRIVEHSQWLLLSKLREFGCELPPEAEALLNELTGQHPEWALQEGQKDEFPTWMESGWGLPSDYSVDQLRGMTTDQIIDLLVNTQEGREGLLDTWRVLARQEAKQAQDVLVALAARNIWLIDVWHSTLNGLANDETAAGSWARLGPLIVDAPTDFIAGTCRPLAWWLRDVTKKLKIDEELAYWRVWDRLIAVALEIVPAQLTDPVGTAINAAAGILVESLFDRFWARKPKVGQGLDEVLEARMTALAADRSPSSAVCRVILCSRLSPLYAIDSEWTKTNLLPLLRWGTNEAILAWEGFLRAPRIDPNLLAEIKPSLLRALSSHDDLPVRGQQLCQLSAISFMEFRDQFTYTELRPILRGLDAGGRIEIARTIGRQIEQSADDNAAYWRNRVAPWIENVWPKELALVVDGTSKALALAVVAAGEAFEEAVDLVLKYIGPVAEPGIVIHKLKTTSLNARSLIQVYPEAALILVDRLISDVARWAMPEWREVLDAIVAAAPQLQESVEYRRVHTYLTLKNR